jgi:pimeloyl-ACP methyl ester carboxylesterase
MSLHLSGRHSRSVVPRVLVPLAVVAALLMSFVSSAAASMRPPRLHWTSCGDAGVLCATLSAPRDYDQPRGKRLPIAVAKSPATDRRHRIGALVFNLGGPGDPAVDLLASIGSAADPELNRRFDLIAIDPRGVGRSMPLSCRVNPAIQGPFSKPLPMPERANEAELVARAREFGRRCGSSNRDILRYASTANVARDVNLLRRALGEHRINYYGLSYGGMLGATLISMFPHHVCAIVLDAAVNPYNYLNHPLRFHTSQARAAERTLARFFASAGAIRWRAPASEAVTRGQRSSRSSSAHTHIPSTQAGTRPIRHR